LRPGAKVLTFLSAKGGCGATTIACHTAVDLPRHTNGKVLIADLDVDAGMVSFLLKTKSPYSLLDAAQNVHRLDVSYWKALVSNGMPGLEMMTAPSIVTGRQTVQPEQVEAVLRFVRTQYDWAIVDLGRGLNKLSLSVVQNSDEVFVVSTAEIPALHQTQQILSRLITSGFNDERLHVILNRPPKRMDVSFSELEKMLGKQIYHMIPNDYAALTESHTDGRLVPAESRVGQSITGLVRKIAGVQTDSSKKRFSIFG
jgi:pilus assembly protein CpaE